ncbi:adh_short, short chain dehydrogenase [Candidatus Phaeomarinobacter ectocarpi]|uniref:Adh_short, short chain dehydrogenase n=1 Tax=Candidatus Phaeomarinibacter ectocarpi TaxID=1458461 RepID=X5MAS1_9HYPH|nr:hypothetical protein [Candidatus Phaeomarinobacter ectocarpi]CDO61048.1 adh_short, short chain dehydrogenase [Candidatus Phaeomarinobacter ectocarpi]
MSLLLIGTSGMLKSAAQQIAKDTPGDVVVLSRRASSFSFDDAGLHSRTQAYDIDWADGPAFLSTLDEVAAAHGPFAASLIWMHGRDEPLRSHIAHQMAADGTLVEVLGSAASRPSALGEVRVRHMQGLPHIRYRQVLLGFVHEDGQSRWLTHEEICAGALQAFASDDTVTIAGQVEPWNLRP